MYNYFWLFMYKIFKVRRPIPKDFEDKIIPCQWEDKDTDIVVQYQIDKKLNLESVHELTQ